MIRKSALMLLHMYQHYISPLRGPSCRYFPSCSHYAKIQFEKNSPLKAFILSLLRIGRCNQLFEGGFDHPKIALYPKKYKQSRISIDKVKYWLVPADEGKYFVIKNFRYKG